MEQRPLRVGDVVDDYCPRERRITNHAIVALVGDAIRQTRCQTCDADHVYKEARLPRRRKKGEADGLDDEALAEVAGTLVPSSAGADVVPVPAVAAAGPDDTEPTPSEPDEAQPRDLGPGEDLWTGHRRLIRAALPRSDSDPPPTRPIPEFTMHQRQRGHGFRSQGWSGQSQGNANANGNANGNRAPHGGGRPRHGGGGGGGGGRPGSRGHGRRGR